MRLVMDRVRARVADVAHAAPDARSSAVAMLEEVLPLDAERLAEAQVWLAFTARSLVDPALAALRDRADEDLHHLCEIAVTALMDQDRAQRRQLDHSLEAERLYALVDGLALHAVTRPSATDPGRVRAVLACHLDTLTGPG